MNILVRSLALVAGWAVYTGLLLLLADRGDASIGAGLLAFALVAVACGVWGFLDGRRSDLRRVTITWTVVGIALGLAVPFLVAWGDGGYDPDTLLSDLLGGLPFIVLLVLVPALVGGAIGNSRRVTAP